MAELPKRPLTEKEKELLKLALTQAMFDSLTEFAGQVVCVYHNIDKQEFTTITEDKVETLLSIEPNLNLVTKFLYGKSITE